MKNLDTGRLYNEQARHYRNQGYYRLPEVFSVDETAAMRDFVSSEATKLTPEEHKRGGPTTKMYGLYDRNPELMHRVVAHPVLTGALISVLGPNIVFLKNRHNHATVNDKPGEPGEGLHRDILQPTRSILTATIYLQASTADNGATRIIPGSQDLPYVGVPEETGGGVWMAEHEEYIGMEDQALSVPMLEGSVLLFSSLVFHGVGANISSDSRMSMTLAYRAIDELEHHPDEARQLVVAGEQTYRGNDR
jgi:phytanoyl-CoA hydroxylase